MIATQNNQLTLTLLHLHYELIIKGASITWRRTGIEHITGNNKRIYLVQCNLLQQPVHKGPVFPCPALAIKVLPKVPVRCVDNAHIACSLLMVRIITKNYDQKN